MMLHLLLGGIAVYGAIALIYAAFAQDFLEGLLWPLWLVFWIIHLAGFRIR